MNRLLLAGLFSLANICLAQTVESVKFYRLDFAVKEVDGAKVTNTRNYAMTISTGKERGNASIRSGDRIPVPTGGNGFNYIDVGVNIDCRNASETADQLALFVSADVSGAVTSDKTLPAPLIRKTQWTSNVVVPLRKATVIFSSDNVGSKGQMQLELTATPIKSN